jgi:hypothetical protein
MAKYIVEVIVSTCVVVEVEACNEEEAQTIALEKVNPSMIDDWECEAECVYRDGDDDYDDDDYDDYDYEDEEEDEEW